MPRLAMVEGAGGIATRDEVLLVNLFGTFCVTREDSNALVIPSRRARTLLAMLCLAKGERLPRIMLSRLLWPGRFKAQAKASLRQALYTLTTCLGDAGLAVVDADAEGVALRENSVTTDLETVMEALDNHDVEAATIALEAAGDHRLIEDAEAGEELAAWIDNRRARADQAVRRSIRSCCAALEAKGEGAAAEKLLRRCPPRWREKFAAEARPKVDFSVAVLPFFVDGDDPRLRDRAAITRCDLTDRLARSDWLQVSPSNESQPNDDDIARETDRNRYEIGGFLSGTGEALRLRLALSNRLSDSQMWSRRLNVGSGDYEAARSGFIGECATSIACEIQIAEATLIGDRTGEDVDSFAAISKIEMLRNLYSADRAREIERHFEDILEANPLDALAHASLAVQLAQNVASRFFGEERPLAQTVEHMARARALAPGHPHVIVSAGLVAAMLGDTPASVRLLEKACRNDPNNPHALASLGWQQCWLSEAEEPIELIRTAERTAQHHPRYSIWALYRGLSWHRLGQAEKACIAYEEAGERNPNYHYNYVLWAASLLELGRESEARSRIEQALHLCPEYRPEYFSSVPNEYAWARPGSQSVEEVRDRLRHAWPKQGWQFVKS